MGSNKNLNPSRVRQHFVVAMVMLCALAYLYSQKQHTSHGVSSTLASGLPSSKQTSHQASQGQHQQHVSLLQQQQQQQVTHQQNVSLQQHQQQVKVQDEALPGSTAVQSPPVSPAAPTSVRRPGTQHLVPLKPTCEVTEATEVVYQVPPDPIGVLFVAHGCHHGALDWWPVSKNCPACTGLPHEVNITREALARGYAVIAVSSADREESRCWLSSSPILSKFSSVDVKAVRGVLTMLLTRLHLTHLPLYALGVSSGGEFVLTLAMGNGLKLAGVCAQVMAVPGHWIDRYMQAVKDGNETDGAVLTPFPPVMFVHMPRDELTAGTVSVDMTMLHRYGVPCHEIQVQPAPLTPATLHAAIPNEITPRQSEAIYKVFKEQQYLDDAGLLLTNPRVSGWRKDIIKAQVPDVRQMRLEDDESPVAEVLNVLYAGHEIVSSTTSAMLDWFESQRAVAEA